MLQRLIKLGNVDGEEADAAKMTAEKEIEETNIIFCKVVLYSRHRFSSQRILM